MLVVISLIRPAQALLTASRRRRAGELLRPDWQPTMRRIRGAGTGGGSTLAAFTRSGSVLSGALLVIGVVFFFGWFVLMLIGAFQREYGVEHDARLRLQRRHRHDTTVTDPSVRQ